MCEGTAAMNTNLHIVSAIENWIRVEE